MKPPLSPLKLGPITVSLLAFSGVVGFSAPASDIEFFEQKIRPILAERCYECHSADSKSLKGNLLLDSREGLLKGGDSGEAITLSKPEKSLLLAAIHYEDPETAMPPKKSGGKLPAAAIADLTAWVSAGAPWPESKSVAKKSSKKFDLAQRKEEHWCWKGPEKSPLPTVKQSDWPRTPSDHFLLEKLESAGLSPAPETDSGTLLRRVTFDLTGLPPSPSHVEAFRADHSASAFAKVVDRLLASPQFGERWARHWLDLVRFAESRGHEFDPPIPNAWQYRDYVVRALNEDVPYLQFVKEHIAGDLLPPRLQPKTRSNESILGTGFWFLNEEVHSPVDMRQDETDRMDNRVDVMSKTFLGLTVACARCHDHKFDAISQKDYYALTGFLISSSQRLVRFETIEQEHEAATNLAKLRGEIAPALLRSAASALKEGVLNVSEQTLSELRKAIPPKQKTATEEAKPFVIADYTKAGATRFMQDGSAFGLGPVKVGDIFPGVSPSAPIAAIATHSAARRDETWKEIQSLGEKDPGTLKDFARSGQTLRTPEFELASGQLWYLVRGAGRAYAVVNSHLMIQGPLHGKVLTSWKATDRWEWVTHNLTSYQGMRAHVELLPEGNGDFEVAMVVDSPQKPELPDGYASPELPKENQALKALLMEVVEQMASGRIHPDSRSAALAQWMLRSLDTLCPTGSPERETLAKETREKIERHSAIAASFNRQSQTATAMFDGSGVDEFLLKRGSPKTPLNPVPRRFVEAIGGAEAPSHIEGSGRKELAEFIASDANPLTSRVIVNRVWHHLFGRGIVATVDNFGVLGQAPSHQALLDTLSVRFATELNWSLKSLIRELVLSRAYAMSSHPSSTKGEEADPENILLHRMNLKRLEGEAIRDSILAVSGRLDPKMGGPSVPIHITSFMEGRGRPKSGPLDGEGRRSLYISIKRNFLSPMMLAFDTPIPFNTMGRRNVSNVPAQSLVLMNDPFVVEQAAVWANKLSKVPLLDERLQSMYYSAFSRPPLPEEKAEALAFLEEQAKALGVPSSDTKVWSDLAHALFGTKEFIHIN